MSYTFEQFEKTYAEVRPPEVPEDFEAQLASKVSRDLRNYILEPQRNPLPSDATFEHMAIGIKLLLAQPWFVEGVEKYLINPADRDEGSDEFNGWTSGTARLLLKWYGIETGLDWVTEEDALATETHDVLIGACYRGAINTLRGEPLDFVFKSYVLYTAKRFNLKEVRDD